MFSKGDLAVIRDITPIERDKFNARARIYAVFTKLDFCNRNAKVGPRLQHLRNPSEDSRPWLQSLGHKLIVTFNEKWRRIVAALCSLSGASLLDSCFSRSVGAFSLLSVDVFVPFGDASSCEGVAFLLSSSV